MAWTPTRRDLFRSALVAGAGLPWIGSRLTAQDPSPVPPPASEARPLWLDAAVKAARWIRTARVQTPRGLLWLEGPERPDGLRSSPELYSGASGVVLFLLELARATGDSSWLEEASSGADHLLATLPDALDTEEGGGDALYTGVSGIGFTLHQTFKATGKETYRQGAVRCLDLIHAAARPSGDGISWGPVTDIVAGAAGTILFLLRMARELDRPASRELALKAGLRLAGLGTPEAGGLKWKWATLPQASERLMPNFSHGTAGIAYALATLHLETGRKEPLDAAVAGGRYLQAVADTSGDGCLVFHHEPGGKDLHYLGWCHGPVGTSRLFLQLARATGDETWQEWELRGARSLLKSGIPEKQTPGFWNNAGQCCGSAGVAEFFLQLHGRTRDPEHLAFARRVARNLLDRATPAGDGLKWVHAEHRVRPDYTYAQTGYMQGAAGIGMLLLHMDAVERGREWTFRLPDSPY